MTGLRDRRHCPMLANHLSSEFPWLGTGLASTILGFAGGFGSAGSLGNRRLCIQRIVRVCGMNS